MSRDPGREADVLVIGAGAAGAALTARLAGHGADVVCLEQGDWIPPAERPKAHADWEVRDRRAWNPNPERRAGPHDYPVASVGPDAVEVFAYNAVGGSTVGYGGHFWRLCPSDFASATLDGFGVDWPIGYGDLEPYYDLNEAVTGVSGLEGDPTGPPRRPDVLLPPLPIGRLGERFVRGFERLGWAWWPQDQAILSVPRDGRAACTNRGFCRIGCPDAALGSADVTWWPRALAAGAELRTRARVREITLHPDGRARGAVWYDRAAGGVVREARGRVVVVAGNGIGTPRLLLMSASGRHPDGLANGSGQVGRNLMVHVQSYITCRFADRLDPEVGTLGVSVTSREFYETDPAADHARGFIISTLRGASPLTVALAAGWGAGHHRAVERSLGHVAGVWVCGDDPPEPHNRVELDPGRLDADGLPGATVRYRLAENSRRLGARAVARARELCAAAGGEEIADTGLTPVLGWHLLGTARMGADPETSVVGPTGRAHEVPNLVVADGSVFPTGGAVNPTNTVQALALRAADAIWAGRRDA